jgi:hypothetical protein
MTKDGRIWRHVIVNTLSSWLHGDPRGFRSRGHRIHSSGDYKNPPPPGEHEALHRYQQHRSAPTVSIPQLLREPIARAFAEALSIGGWQVAIISVSDKHLHASVRLPRDRAATRRIVGEAKKFASRSVRAQLPGRFWPEGGVYKPIRNAAHLAQAFEYIRTRQEEGATAVVFFEPTWDQ